MRRRKVCPDCLHTTDSHRKEGGCKCTHPPCQCTRKRADAIQTLPEPERPCPHRAEGEGTSEERRGCNVCLGNPLDNVDGDPTHFDCEMADSGHHALLVAEREKSERFRRVLTGLLRDTFQLQEGDRITAIAVRESDLVEARAALKEKE